MSEGGETPAEESKRLGWVEKQLVDQDALLKGERDRNRAELASVTARLDQVTAHMDAIQKAFWMPCEDRDGARAKVDSRLDDQQKVLPVSKRGPRMWRSSIHRTRCWPTRFPGSTRHWWISSRRWVTGGRTHVVQQDQAVKHLAASLDRTPWR
ncbi:MAG: hypothetical protein IPJ44_20725 [Nitrospira sp.]|nr:hypothetical protein [Nitrospira sp.]